MRFWAVICVPDVANNGKQITPSGSVLLRTRKIENVMVVPAEAIVGQAHVITVENKGPNGAPSAWIINHRIDLTTFNHIGAYTHYDDDL